MNSDFVFRHIILRLDELLFYPDSSDPLEMLAKTQALLLYSIILIFDGGVRFQIHQKEICVFAVPFLLIMRK